MVSKKLTEQMRDRQSNKPRLIHRANVLFLTINQLTFIDESFFNRTTGWQYHAYILIWPPDQYHTSCRRKHS